MLKRIVWSLCLLVSLVAGARAGELSAGAQWELKVLGITNEQRLAEVRELAGRRAVTIAVVGFGISESGLAAQLGPLVHFRYRGGSGDPYSGTHDTGQAGVILDLTNALGIRVKLLTYQSEDAETAFGEAFAEAARNADIVVEFFSCWGDTTPIQTAMVKATNALFISPYAESGGNPTNVCQQGHAAKPGGEGIANFILAAPLARSGEGGILMPSNRGPDVDTEVINFIAPSYYASGLGGTCPAAAVLTAVAAYIYASSPVKPDPLSVVQLLRETVRVDRSALAGVPEFGSEQIARLQADIAKLLALPPDGTRKLDAVGVINLYEIYRRLAHD